MKADEIKQWIRSALGLEGDFAVEHPKDMSHGDFAANVALIEAKKQNKNPKEIAESFVAELQKNLPDFIEKIEVAGPGFINILLKGNVFANAVTEVIQEGEKFGKNDDLKEKKFFIEHTQPNPFKEFHIGHLMNNAIGESIARIIRANGALVKTASYHGDKGLHIAKAVWAVTKEIPLPKAYAYGHEAFETNEESKLEILEINKKIYDGTDEKINDLYKAGRENSFKYFESLYDRLDSHFDYHFYESESGEIGKKLVEENIGNVFEVGDGGAIVFHGENFIPKTHTRVFLNSEKLPTYEAKELGLAQIKKEIFPYDFSLTVTANEQDAFFQVVEVAIGEVFGGLKGKLKHVSHGLLKLPSGKMSSRTGSVISAVRLLNQVTEKVLEKMADREMSEEMKKQVAEIVAIGAIKYSILRQAIGGDIIFDFDKSLSFEGDSGPYLQYSTVRAKAVLQKAKNNSIQSGTALPVDWKTTELEKMLTRYPEVVARAGKEYAPHHLVTYLVELATAFNGFYAVHKIVDTADSSAPYKVALTSAFAQIMQNGLNLLGIKVPTEM